MHLCNNHMESSTSTTFVSWGEHGNQMSFMSEERLRSLVAQYEGFNTRQMSDQCIEIHENEDETIDQCDDDMDPPGYEEADSFPTVSAWDDYRINKTGNLIRQYSIRLVQMVSSGSASATEDPEAQNTLPRNNDQPNS